ncbi:hypothetical protein N7491_006471 [Penicillium cf. griseofulvum]|uniref:Uncharacterized protein n=1 Tax=Penicillium cf. griseofulvum TaxID=2972120 RepID=A0A9W9IX64_9EURO|nr:hypothetical protein N7472_010499 [Penicillium cf. griseofulvum]KAJ5429455.1 hypothetical protein N7491_006471 [Penicillium cf. griseofulvum]
MRYSIINSLLLLAISPMSVLALPIDPNDLAGQWDPSGLYRKGQWQHGVFVPNNGDTKHGQLEKEGQWLDNNNNNNNNNNQNGQYDPSQNGWTDANGQWHTNNQNGWTDSNGQWHAASSS